MFQQNGLSNWVCQGATATALTADKASCSFNHKQQGAFPSTSPRWHPCQLSGQPQSSSAGLATPGIYWLVDVHVRLYNCLIPVCLCPTEHHAFLPKVHRCLHDDSISCRLLHCSGKSPRYDKPSLKIRWTVKDVSATSAGWRQVTPNYSVSLEGSTGVCPLYKDQESWSQWGVEVDPRGQVGL